MKTEHIKSLDQLLRSRFFESFEDSKLGNDLFINDPERAERIHSAAENGSDGSTHAEKIDDMREANQLAESEVYRAMFGELGFEKFTAETLASALREEIDNEIDDCEQWHAKNNSLNSQVG